MKILSLLTFLAAAMTIYFDYQDKRFVWFFKPLTMIFIVALAWFFSERKGFYHWAILAGFVFSLVGDTLLINPQNFVFGLASFLVAHLFYIAAFFKAGAGKLNPISPAAYLVGFAIFMLISGGVPGNLQIPVMFYALAISTMLGAAVNFYFTQKTPQSLFALAGAAFFVLSDSLLAYNKFNEEFFLAKLLILSTYFLAQWLIAKSLTSQI